MPALPYVRDGKRRTAEGLSCPLAWCFTVHDLTPVNEHVHELLFAWRKPVVNLKAVGVFDFVKFHCVGLALMG